VRVLVVTQYFWPETFRINELVQMLVSRGHTVTVLTGIPNYPSGEVFAEYSKDPHRFSDFEGVEVIRVPMVSRGHRRIQLALNYVTFAVSGSIVGPWRLRKREFDVIFAYEPSPITVGIPAAVLRSRKKIPSLLWILDLWPETPVALGMLPARPFVSAVEWMVRKIYAHTDVLLVQSPGFVAAVRRYAPPPRRVEYFPSWADAVFDGALPKPAPEVPIMAGSFDVVFAGNIGEAQDFGTIVAAAELLRDRENIRFVIVGDGRQSAWLANEVATRKLASTVLLVGRHPVDRMPEFFAHAAALLVPLRADEVFAMTIPAKVQAYMASGRPIIAVLDGEGAEAVRRWECGVVVRPGDADGLAKAILELADAPSDVRDLMGENGRRGATIEFNREVLVDRLETWIDELVSGSRSS
jgi:colanic acid biosynthesis glycosyl transferase WcaI